MCEAEGLAGELEDPPAGHDLRLEGLGAVEAIPVQWMDNPRESTCGSGRTCLQVAPEDEPAG
jgi:hypothetical protein